MCVCVCVKDIPYDLSNARANAIAFLILIRAVFWSPKSGNCVLDFICGDLCLLEDCDSAFPFFSAYEFRHALT